MLINQTLALNNSSIFQNTTDLEVNNQLQPVSFLDKLGDKVQSLGLFKWLSKPDVEPTKPPDYYHTIQEVVELNGFHFESHEVTTEDGYRLNVFRVMNDKVKNGVKQPVVFMQHGLLATADTWVYNNPDVAPAFTLAKCGYDIWLGNNRGNQYSREHVDLDADADQAEYFDYSFADLGEYDLPAQIDMVREKTGVEKVTYMAHSQGTTQMFYALAKHEDELMEKVNLFVALAPVTRLNAASSSIKLAASHISIIQGALYSMSIHELFDTSTRVKWHEFMSSFTGKLLSTMKDLMMSAVSSGKYTDPLREEAATCRFPNEASTKEIYHYGQIINAKRIQEYDYGALNMEKYGQETAPEIKLSDITKMPVALFVGKQDSLASPFDTEWARDQLGNVVWYQEMDHFDHGAFTMGKDMSYMSMVILTIAEYNQNPLPNSDNIVNVPVTAPIMEVPTAAAASNQTATIETQVIYSGDMNQTQDQQAEMLDLY